MRSSHQIFYWCLLLLLGSAFAKAQSTTIAGTIIDAKTSEPLMGVAVYISGTSIGVASDIDGNFSIEYSQEYNSPLVFSFLGYDKLQVQDPASFDTSIIRLTMRENQLEAVVINPDPWDRATKERLFRTYFLGSNSVEHSRILNIKQVRLRFNPETKIMTAVADIPIIIRNEKLDYEITYDLADFEINFKKRGNESPIQETYNVEHSPRRYYATGSYIGGTSFYKNIPGSTMSDRKRDRVRDRAYKRSLLRMYRAISQEKMKEYRFKLHRRGFRVEPEEHIRSNFKNGIYEVVFRHLDYTVLDRDGEQTDLILKDNYIYIDSNGNNLSPRDLLLKGFLPKLGVAGSIPLDYKLDDDAVFIDD